MRSIVVFLAIFTAGCAATGVKVSEEQAQGFRVGRSTYADVVTALGQPSTTSTNSNGTRIAIYTYSAVQSRPQNFIPYIGPLVAGYDRESSAVTFTFDASGVLANTTTSQSNAGTGVGLASGSSAPVAPTAQPR